MADTPADQMREYYQSRTAGLGGLWQKLPREMAQREGDRWEADQLEAAAARAEYPDPNDFILRRAELQASGLEPDQIDRQIARAERSRLAEGFVMREERRGDTPLTREQVGEAVKLLGARQRESNPGGDREPDSTQRQTQQQHRGYSPK